MLASGISTVHSVSWNDPWMCACFCTILLKILYKWFFITKYFHSNKDEKLKITDLCFQFEKLGKKKCESNVVQVEGKWIIEQTSIELENGKKKLIENINKVQSLLFENTVCNLILRFMKDCTELHTLKTFKNLSDVCMHTQSFPLWLTRWTVTHQSPLSVGFSRQEFWRGFTCYPSGDLPNPWIETDSLMSTCNGRWILYH